MPEIETTLNLTETSEIIVSRKALLALYCEEHEISQKLTDEVDRRARNWDDHTPHELLGYEADLVITALMIIHRRFTHEII